jgi:hypothetical protein
MLINLRTENERLEKLLSKLEKTRVKILLTYIVESKLGDTRNFDKT